MFTTTRPSPEVYTFNLLITGNGAIPIIITTISVLNILLHGIGFNILMKTYTRGIMTTQQLLILHISIGELLENCVWLVLQVLLFVGSDMTSASYGYCFCTHLALKRVLYLLMLFITIDRLLAVLLNFRYGIIHL